MAKQSYHQVIDGNARLSHKSGKKTLDHIRIHEAENGGHLVEHHFDHGEGPYQEPEQHVFGKGEGNAVIAHISKHLGITGDEDGDREKGEAGHKAEATGASAE